MGDVQYPPGVQKDRPPDISGTRGNSWVDAWLIDSKTVEIGSKQFLRTEEGPCPQKTATGTGGADVPPAKWRKDYYKQSFETTNKYAIAVYTEDTNWWWWGGVILAGIGVVLVALGTFGVGGVITVTVGAGAGATTLTVTTLTMVGTVVTGTGPIVTAINQGSGRYQRGKFLNFGTDTVVINFEAELAPQEVAKCP
jgi:hypothetical protein